MCTTCHGQLSQNRERRDSSIHLLHGGATSAACASEAAAGHASFGHASATASSLVYLHHDRIDYTFQFLLFALELVLLGELVLIEPIQRFLDSVLDLLLVPRLKLFLQFFLLEGVPHCEAIILQPVLGLDFRPVSFVLCPELLGLLHHA